MAKDAKGHGSDARGGSQPNSLERNPYGFLQRATLKGAMAGTSQGMPAHAQGVEQVGKPGGFKDMYGNPLEVGHEVRAADSGTDGVNHVTRLYNEAGSGRPLASVTHTSSSGSKVTSTAYPENLRRVHSKG
jgi:hypothetical protein